MEYYNLTFKVPSAVNFDPIDFGFVAILPIFKICNHFFSSCPFLLLSLRKLCFYVDWSWNDVMTWRQSVTSWHEITSAPMMYTPAYFEFHYFFQIGPLMVTKILRRFQTQPWRHDIFMTSCHDVINTDFVQKLLFLEIDIIERRDCICFYAFYQGVRKK